MWFIRLILASLIILGVALTQTSMAAENQAAEDEKSAHQLQAITVTVQKRPENAQEVPAAVSTLSEVQIQDADIHDTNEISPYIPNFSTMSSGDGFSFYSIRGMSNSMYLSPAVGFYVDGAPSMGSENITDTTLYDLERVEVLRGAQGNLYGMNTSGGVVNIITKRPGDIWEAKASATYQEYDATRLTAAISGPVVKDKLYLSVSGYYKTQNKSFFENTLNDTEPQNLDNKCGRIKLLYTPTSTLDIEYAYSPNKLKGRTRIFSTRDDDPFTFQLKDASYIKSEIDSNGHSLRVKYQTGYFDVVSITAYNETTTDFSLDFDYFGTGYFLKKFMEDFDAFSQEIRLVSPESSTNFKWLIGGYYSHKNNDNRSNMIMDAAIMMPVDPGQMVSDSMTKAQLEYTTYSVFGQASYPIFDKLRLTLGLRYDVDRKKTDYHRDNPYEFSAGGPVSFSYDASETWNAWSPKMVLDYQFTPEILSYFSITKSYKAGGFAVSNVDTADAAKFNPEYAWSYEIGLKTSWFDNRLTANLAAFITKAEDLQLCTYTNGIYVYQNAGKSTMKGLELEISARPLPGMDIMASFGLLDARFDEYEVSDAAGNRSDLSGNYVPLAPKFTANLMAQYRFKWGGYIRGQAHWVGDTFYDEYNVGKQEAYCIANAKIGYETKHVDVYLFANNLFDKVYYNYMWDTTLAPGGKMGMPGLPRIVGVMAKFYF